MKKRSFLISAVILPNIAILLIALMLHRHNARDPRDPYGKLAAQGLRPGIMAKQVEDAKTAIVNERRMWSTFQDMSAHAHIDYEDQQGTRVSLDGPLSLKRESPAGPAIRLDRPVRMTLCDEHGKWKVTTDGTTEGTAISSENANLRATLSSLDMPAVLRLLMFPRDFLLGLYSDNLSPQTGVTFEELMESRLQAYLPSDTKAPPRSFVFICKQGSVSDPKFEFRDGHLYRWRIGGVWGPRQGPLRYMDATAFYFEDPVTTKGFSYPTVFRIQPMPEEWPYPDAGYSLLAVTNVTIGRVPCTNKGMLRIRLSELSVISD